MTSYSSTISAADQGGATPITAIHPDIILTHILTRLDGPTLASAGCASPLLHQLCTEEKLWRDICNSTWTSANDPRVRDIISTFPTGHRSFFSDCFPTLRHRTSQTNHHRRLPTSELVSAVDIKYENMMVYSKVEVMETVTESPFWVDLLDPKETVGIPLKSEGNDGTLLSHLEESMTLSWIVIDPTRKRAANVSSLRPVRVRRHCATGEVQLRYATIIAGGSSEFVQCKIGVTCGMKGGREFIVKAVNLQVVDMDGECLCGEESLVILQEALERGERGRRGRKGEERERYEEYVEMTRERRGKMDRRRRRFYFFVFQSFGAFILLIMHKLGLFP